ncbi:MAG: hypothetical protein M8866_08875 [marine benthic group bacterium]|jgi:hypothetical protein|nr:hypothetical protein [Candidatus Benthicola marisminoris]
MNCPLRVLLAAAVLAFPAFLTSCDGQAPSAPEVDLAAVEAQPAAKAGAGGHIVSGKGTLWVPEPWNAYMILPFHAQLGSDGSVKGKWHHQLRGNAGGGRVIVEVLCMTVQGNEAWLGGRSTFAQNPNNIGKFFALYVIDNGEGEDAPPDRMTRTLWFGSDEQRMWGHCTYMPTDYDVWPLAGGNVQVR